MMGRMSGRGGSTWAAWLVLVFGIAGLVGIAMPSSAEARDRDRDGLSNAFERSIGSDPRRPDSDDDGLGDAAEVWIGSDPMDMDSDDDGLEDGDEVAQRCDPTDADSDDDGRGDGDETEEGTDPSEPEAHERELVGDLAALVCPTEETEGSITVGTETVPLALKTRFEDGTRCDILRDALEQIGPFPVEVRIKISRSGVVWAKRVRIADADDGDDGDGDVDDDEDGDHDGDGDHHGEDDDHDGDDGEDDGEDHDHTTLDGVIQAMTCPTEEGLGSMTIDGIEVVLVPETVYRGEATCHGMASLLQEMGELEAEIEIDWTDAGKIALVVELDRDDDGDDPDDEGGDDELEDEGAPD